MPFDLVTSEAPVRLGAFVGVFVAMAGWEALAARRQLTTKRAPRWFANLGLVVLNTIAVRLLIPITATAAALRAGENGWGLFNQFESPAWLEFALTLVVFDFAIWLQHVLFHRVPWLWRLHLVHHADLDLDVTSGLRFHTLEILLSMLLKLGVVVLLGPPAAAVVTFEVVLNATSMFNHGNARMPAGLDRALRWFVVTPDMHRVHHSIDLAETNSNYGFNLPWWDRLFGTYHDQPAAGHASMTIGLSEPREERIVARLPGLLTLPFRRRAKRPDR